MNNGATDWGFLRDLSWEHVGFILAVLALSRVMVVLVRWAVRWAADGKSPRLRLLILRTSPILRVLIDLSAIGIIVPILVEPTFQNVVALAAAVSLALAFALKDYVSSMAAGVVSVMEEIYQPGDWIEVDGVYGQVKLVGVRALRLVTPDDTEVIVPHSKIWARSLSNSNSGKQGMLCVADFYLHPDHDASVARAKLMAVAEASALRQPETPVTVIVSEKPWGTQYKVKAYVRENREQFQFASDLTIRGKEALRAMDLRFAQAPYAKTVG